MKYQLLQTLSRLSSERREWLMYSLKLRPDLEPEHCADFWMGNDTRVWVSLLDQIASTDVIRRGLMAHQAMLERATPTPNVRDVNVVVIPGLAIQHPLLISSRVIIASPSVEVLTEGLHRLSKEVCLQASTPNR